MNKFNFKHMMAGSAMATVMATSLLVGSGAFASGGEEHPATEAGEAGKLTGKEHDVTAKELTDVTKSLNNMMATGHSEVINLFYPKGIDIKKSNGQYGAGTTSLLADGVFMTTGDFAKMVETIAKSPEMTKQVLKIHSYLKPSNELETRLFTIVAGQVSRSTPGTELEGGVIQLFKGERPKRDKEGNEIFVDGKKVMDVLDDNGKEHLVTIEGRILVMMKTKNMTREAAAKIVMHEDAVARNLDPEDEQTELACALGLKNTGASTMSAAAGN